MKRLVYIAHPVRGDVAGNLAKGRQWVRWAYEKGVAPAAPWITGCEVLDDANEVHRELGLQCDETTVARCDEIWLCGARISQGMHRELEIAMSHGVYIRRFINSEEDKGGFQPYELSTAGIFG